MPNQNDRQTAFSAQGLVIVFADSALKSTQNVSGQRPYPWVYLGVDPLKRRQLVEGFGSHFELIDIARLQRKIAGETKEQYVSWHDDLNRSYSNEQGWWFGAVSSRNVRQSHVFQFYCFLEVLKQLWASDNQRPRLIVVESEALAECIRRWAVGEKIPVEIRSGFEIFIRRLKCQAYTFLRWGKFWAVVFLRSLTVFLLRAQGLKPVRDTGDDCLVVTTVHDYSLTATGEFSDRYFPLLHSLLEQSGRRVLVCPFFYGFGFDYFSIYHRLRKSQTRFVLPEDLLGLLDYWDILIYPLGVLTRGNRFKEFKGFDLSFVIREEFCYQDTVLGLEPFLIYKAYLRMAQRFSSLKKAIVWYENRVIDRAVVMGLRQSYPSIEVGGVQMYLHPHYFLSMAPSKSEIEAGIVPHRILTTSDLESKKARVFSSQVNCQPAAALRYQHLFKHPQEEKMPASQKNGILIILPYDIGEAVEILSVVADAVPRINEKTRFLIKAHPDYTLEQLKENFGNLWPVCFEDFDGNLTQGVSLTELVISGMSSAMVEAAVMGAPVIFVGGQTSLDENFMAGLGFEMTTECFSGQELAQAIKRYTSLSVQQRESFRKDGERLRELYFLPINETTLRPYLMPVRHKD